MSVSRYLDLKRSFVAGPLKIFFTLVGYVFLYPIILNQSGPKVLGLWSLLAAMPVVLNNFDIGFSLILMRDVGRAENEQQLKDAYFDYIVARKTYIWIIILLLFLSVFIYSFLDLTTVYNSFGFSFALTFTIFALGLQLIGRLYAAILSGSGHTYYTQIIEAIVPMIIVMGSLLGAIFLIPLEGYSVGLLVASIIRIVVLRRKIKRNLPYWPAMPINWTLLEYIKHLLFLIKRGWHLYSSSLGIMIREPILRYTVASLFGLEIAGLYDIAIRVSRTGREIVASGFLSLYPIFSHYIARNKQKEVLKTSIISLVLLMISGGLSLSLLLILNEFIFNIWLGEFSAFLVKITGILIIWNGITLLNVPFWYLLQAGGFEKKSAIAIWLHSILTIMLIPLAIHYNFNVTEVLTLWVFFSLFTQVMIFYYVEKEMGMFFPIANDGTIRWVFVRFLFMICSGIALGCRILPRFSLLYYAIFFFFCIIVFSLIPVFFRFYREMKRLSMSLHSD